MTYRPGSTAASGVGEGGSGVKRSSSTQQQIRMAQKEQKLYETQEYIQVYGSNNCPVY